MGISVQDFPGEHDTELAAGHNKGDYVRPNFNMMASDLPASKLRRIGPLWAEACRRQAVIVRRLFKDRAGAFQETGDFDTLLTAVEEDFSIPFPSIETCIDEQIAAIVAVGHIWGGTVIDSIRGKQVGVAASPRMLLTCRIGQLCQ